MPIKRLLRFFNRLFKKKKQIKLGIYGPPNGGKTTLANRICLDWLGEELGSASHIPHETRRVQMKERVVIQSGDGKTLDLTVVDTPGIATKIDYENFVKKGLSKKEARARAREATRGVIEAIKWLDNVDAVIVVLDATKNPVDQVNVTILGNLEARKIPFMIVANKIDLKKANVTRIREAFPNAKVIGISAKYGHNMDKFYEALFELVG